MDIMKFIYTDSNYTELGVLKNTSIDFEVGKFKTATNDYSLEISINAWDKAFNKGSIFYSSESEFGGIIDSKKVDTSKNVIVFTGKTFRGMLEKEYIQPPEGQAYFVAKGEANSVINELIGDNFDSLFTVDNVGLSDINVNYQIRDLNLLDALEKMLYKADIPSRLDIVFHDGKVHIQAIPIVDLSELLQYDKSYGITMIAQTPESSYNHIIALGKGELTERLRVNLYLQSDKTWSSSKNDDYKGLCRKTYLYDNSSEDDEISLIEGAVEAVEKENGSSTVQAVFSSDDASLFDIVGAKEEITELSFKEQITKKILKVTVNDIAANCKFEYKVGE